MKTSTLLVLIAVVAGALPALAQGDLPAKLEKGDIETVVQQNQAGIADCVDKENKKEPKRHGTLTMKFTVQPDGHVDAVSVAESSAKLQDTVMASCMTGLIRRWVFPMHEKAGDPITYPFKF